MTADRERIERMVAAGKLARAEADELLAALGNLEDRAGRVESRDQRSSAAMRMKLAYLRGQLSAEDLDRAQKRAAVRMGLLFGLLTWLINSAFFAFDDGQILRAFVVSLPHLFLGGPLFGWVMYRLHLQPASRKLGRLVTDLGAPLEPPTHTPHGRCPTCSAENYKTWGPSHPAMIHWVLNPGLAFNELALGQRVPRRMNICRECGTNWFECPACERSYDSALLSARQSFGQWAGIPCPGCSEPIPSLRNWWAALVARPLELLTGRAPAR